MAIPELTPGQIRTCNHCHEDLPATIEFFHKDAYGRFGLGQTCKICHSVMCLVNYRRNRPERLLKRRDYAARTRSPGSRKDEYLKARTRILDYQRAYYLRNAARIKARVNADRLAHPEETAERKRIAHVLNRAYDNARCEAWVKSHPEHTKANTARRRARLRAAGGQITATDIAAQYDTQRATCHYCPSSIAHGRFHVDHYVPLAKGGSNEPSNMVLACPECNKAKKDLLPEAWSARLARRATMGATA